MSLSEYREKIDVAMKADIATFGIENKLRDACEYVLLGDGKRLRPILVLAIAEALGHELDVTKGALAVEYFHVASLIADDLPCMDDDDERRGQPSLHKVYGETTALLASYGLISEAFLKVQEASTTLSESPEPFSKDYARRGLLALKFAGIGSGFQGATGGQYLDMYPDGTDLDSVIKVIEKKTMRLFEVAFAFGWIFGGGELDQLDRITQLAYDFGMAFQIADDLSDFEKDTRDGEQMNLAILHGRKEAGRLFEKYLASFSIKLKELGLDTPLFDTIQTKVMAHACTGSLAISF